VGLITPFLSPPGTPASPPCTSSATSSSPFLLTLTPLILATISAITESATSSGVYAPMSIPAGALRFLMNSSGTPLALS